MKCCAYCGQPATVEIPSNPGQVCLTHAEEFWTGFLAYVKDRADPRETPETPCICGACNELSAVHARSIAGTAAGLSPRHTEPVPVRRASSLRPALSIVHSR